MGHSCETAKGEHCTCKKCNGSQHGKGPAGSPQTSPGPRRYEYPGKFEGGLHIDPYVHEIFGSDFEGDTNDFGLAWASGKIEPHELEGPAKEAGDALTPTERRFIKEHPYVVVEEDSSGFVHVLYYNDPSEMDRVVEEHEKDYDAFYADSDA